LFCGQRAARVTLFEPGESAERTQRHGLLLQVDFIGQTSVAPPAGEEREELLSVLATAEAAALHAFSPELATFFCSDCGLAYCARHWLALDTFDDGFYGATYGVCPRGHRKMFEFAGGESVPTWRYPVGLGMASPGDQNSLGKFGGTNVKQE